MSAHTLGPWRATVRRVGSCLYALEVNETCYGGHEVYSEFVEPLGIQMHGLNFDTSHATAKMGPPPSSADARLIAAAPDLLAALTHWREHAKGTTGGKGHFCLECGDGFLAAIAKAEGR